MVQSVRRWWGLVAGLVVLVGLVTFVRTHPAAAPSEVVTYELTGQAQAVQIQYGDIFDVTYSPHAATFLDHAPMPWRTTVPMAGSPTHNDLGALGTDPPGAPITCTVRRGAAVIATQVGVGRVSCDVTPVSANLVR